MLQPTQTPQTQPAPAGAQTTQTPEQEDAMTAEQLLAGVLEARGGVPQAPEGQDPKISQLEERVFQQDIAMTVNNETEALLEISPDMTRSDARRIVLARAQNDVVGLYQAVEKVVRKLTEKSQNDDKSEDLRVEPANSGSPGTDDQPVRNMADAVQGILSSIKSRSAA